LQLAIKTGELRFHSEFLTALKKVGELIEDEKHDN
jgi:hypothetical protein